MNGFKIETGKAWSRKNEKNMCRRRIKTGECMENINELNIIGLEQNLEKKMEYKRKEEIV